MLLRLLSGLVRLAVKVGLLGCLLVTLLAFGGRWHWYLDQFSHLRPQYLAAAGLALCYFILTARPKWAVTAGLTAALNMAVLLPHVTPLAIEEASTSDEATTLHIATINLYGENQDLKTIETLLRTRQPDMVAFQEVSLRWQQAISQWKDLYPYQTFGGRAGSYFHLGIISKQPWKQKDMLKVGKRTDGLTVEFEWQGKTVSLLDIHAKHPTSGRNVVYITAQHDAIIQWVQEKSASGHNVIVLGDFNCSPWSSHFQRLVKLSGLLDTSRGRPFVATRHVLLPDRLMIDHIFLKGDWKLRSREVGPDFGSDHRPVFATIEL